MRLLIRAHPHDLFLAFSALRIYAIWDRSIFLGLVILALNLVPFATNVVCSRKHWAGMEPVLIVVALRHFS